VGKERKMLPERLLDRFGGRWRIRASDGASMSCYGLEVYADREPRGGLFTDLLWWKPGRLGCDTTSSDLVRVQLDSRLQGSEVAMSGHFDLMDQSKSAPVRLTVSLESTPLQGLLETREGRRSVLLEEMELEPIHDIE
jgi:hypothetical protein